MVMMYAIANVAERDTPHWQLTWSATALSPYLRGPELTVSGWAPALASLLPSIE